MREQSSKDAFDRSRCMSRKKQFNKQHMHEQVASRFSTAA